MSLAHTRAPVKLSLTSGAPSGLSTGTSSATSSPRQTQATAPSQSPPVASRLRPRRRVDLPELDVAAVAVSAARTGSRLKKLLADYYRTSTIAIIAAFFYLLVWLLSFVAPPSHFANWLWPDSYLLIQILLAAGNFFLFTFLCQSRRAGSWAALSFWTVLFFHFAHFRLTFPLIFALILESLIWWYFLVYRPGRLPSAPSDN